MKSITIGLYVMALFIGLFGYWGLFTTDGSAHYEEMAGMIPFFALLISVVMLLTAIILSIILYYKSRKLKLKSNAHIHM